ncbi:MAG: transaldolase [Phycisphaerales bacterium]|nr:transaldolase [Phycisphaerales bacterium]
MTPSSTTVVLAADHAALGMRNALIDQLRALGWDARGVGPDSGESVDFPCVAGDLCREIGAGRATHGILLCGSGAGMSMAANRFPGIRAATAHDTYTAHQMVEHDAANVLTLGARVIGIEVAHELAVAFLEARFSGQERHRRRLAHLIRIERHRTMNPCQQLHDAGQAIWLDYISRSILDDGTLARYTSDLAVTGLTSNPSILQKAVEGSDLYDDQLAQLHASNPDGDPETFAFALAISDLTRAADILRTAWDVSGHTDGFVSLEVSPGLAMDAKGTIEQGLSLYAQADRPNLMIKVPGTPAGPEAIEALIYRGVNVNVTLLFDECQYRAAAEAYVRGLERRHAEGLSLDVASVASIFVSRWDTPTHEVVGEDARFKVGIAATVKCHQASKDIFSGPRWETLAAAGAHEQKVLMASTSTKDPALRDTMYVEALAAEGTVDTIPEATLLAFADHGTVGDLLGETQWAQADAVLASAEASGVDLKALAAQLQEEGAAAFVKSWDALLEAIAEKTASLQSA